MPSFVPALLSLLFLAVALLCVRRYVHDGALLATLRSTAECVPLDTSSGTLYWPSYAPPDGLAAPNEAGVPSAWRVEWCKGAASSLLPAALAAGQDAYMPGLPEGTLRQCQGRECSGALVFTRLHSCPVGPQCHSGSPPSILLGCQGPSFAEPPAPELVGLAWELGPDELLVLLEGPEFLSLQGTHVGGCRYIFPFSLTLPGTYRAVALGLRSAWSALNETGAMRVGDASAQSTASFPAMHLDNLLGDRQLLHIGGTGAGAEEARLAALQAAAGSSDALPACSQPSPPGRYVRISSTEAEFDAPAPWYTVPRIYTNGDKGSGTLSFYSSLPDSLRWVPYACAATPTPPAAITGCLAGTSLVFRGDSQVRSLFNGLLASACGSSEAAVIHGQDYCLAGSGQQCGEGFRACLRWDPYGEAAPAPQWDGMCQSRQGNCRGGEAPPEVALVNFAQWPFSGHSHWSMARYSAAVEEYGSRLGGGDGLRALWVETPHLCIRNEGFIHSYRDWRTTHRIVMSRRAAELALQPALLEGRLEGILRLQGIADPLMDLCPDTAHISSPNILSAITDAVVKTIC